MITFLSKTDKYTNRYINFNECVTISYYNVNFVMYIIY